MAKGAYIGIDNIARKVKNGYIGVDGVARKIKAAYIGIDGVASPCWDDGEKTWDDVFAAIADGTYKKKFAIGDCIPLDLGSEGVVNMQIIAFDTDDLADGSGKAPISWLSEQLLATSHRMNPTIAGEKGAYTEGTGGIGGWEKCEMRTYLKETVKPLIPEAVRSAIKDVTKTQTSYNSAGSRETQTTTDDVWLPSKDEMFGASSLYFGMFQDTNELRIKKKGGATSADYWWLRSASYTHYFTGVNTSGVNSDNYAYRTSGVALGFCT